MVPGAKEGQHFSVSRARCLRSCQSRGKANDIRNKPPDCHRQLGHHRLGDELSQICVIDNHERWRHRGCVCSRGELCANSPRAGDHLLMIQRARRGEPENGRCGASRHDWNGCAVDNTPGALSRSCMPHEQVVADSSAIRCSLMPDARMVALRSKSLVPDGRR